MPQMPSRGITDEAREYLVELFGDDKPLAERFIERAWRHGFKLAPLDEHDIAVSQLHAG